MKLPVRSQLLLMVCLVVSCATPQPTRQLTADYYKGEANARADIKHGRMTWLDNLGLIGPGSEESKKFLLTRYKIGYRLDYNLTSDYVDGHNAVVYAEGERRFGKRFWVADIEEKYPELGPVPLGPYDTRSEPPIGNRP
jgi:hypothetical protein